MEAFPISDYMKTRLYAQQVEIDWIEDDDLREIEYELFEGLLTMLEDGVADVGIDEDGKIVWSIPNMPDDFMDEID